MASLKFYLNRKADADGLYSVYLRLSVSRSCVLRGRTNVRISDRDWDNVSGRPKKAVRIMTDEYRHARVVLPAIESHIMDMCSVYGTSDARTLSRWITEAVGADIAEDIPSAQSDNVMFLDVFDSFISERESSRLVTPLRIKHYRKAYGMWDRFEMYTKRRRVLADMSVQDLESFRKFFFGECRLFSAGPDGKPVPAPRWSFMYDKYPTATRYACQERSRNYFVDITKILICVWRWASDNVTPLNNIFSKFDCGKTVYGTPWYILPEVRNRLYAADLSKRPELAVQRDIFVFQSLVGCRYGDLSRLTKDNIIDGCLEYIAGKTSNSDPRTIRVPLHPTAREIMARYDGCDRAGRILPFISEQKYNRALKDVFLLVPECDMQVTVLDPKTRVERKVYLHEVASSHMARRNLIGSLKEGGFADEDICAISGHADGSRAISRYRKISDDLKRKMIDNI